MPSGSSNSGGTGSGRRFNRGRWTRQEHEQFLRGLEGVGEVWCLVSTYVPTRTELQVRTHAQKYFRKVRQGLPFPEEPYQSAAESGSGRGSNAGSRAHNDGGAAAAVVAGNGGAGSHVPLHPAAASRHGAPAMAPPHFDGFGRSSARDPGWAPIDGGHGGSYGGGAAPLSAPVPSAAAASPMVHPDAACLAHNLDGVWVPGGVAPGAPVFMGQQHLQQQIPPGRGYGADAADGGFSPPHGEDAPFRNWPVADDSIHSSLLLEHGTADMGASNDDEAGGGGGGDPALGYLLF